MKFFLRTNLCISILLFVVACGDPTTDSDAYSPSSNITEWTIRADSSCIGKAQNISVYIDNVYVGLIQPGSSGITREVTIGSHLFEAEATNGNYWPLSTSFVPEEGKITTLTCS